MVECRRLKSGEAMKIDLLRGASAMTGNWRLFALGSASFAALTAICAKIGVTEMNSNLATLCRTVIILCVSALIVWWRHEWQRPDSLSGKGLVFLILSGVATGLSWLCYFRAL